jgi:CRISPR-associated protein Csx10
MKALTFELHLVQPVLIGQMEAGEENSAISYAYIAGSTLRGALISRYLERHGPLDPVRDPTARRLFFSRDVTYLNLYPATDAGERTLPCPRSWQVEKALVEEADAPLVDAALGASGSLKNPKAVTKPFYQSCEKSVERKTGEIEKTMQATLYQPKRHTGLHNASDRRFVKQESDSVVFRYEALAAGQSFAGAILSKDASLLDRIAVLLAPADLFLGRSRSAAYGHVRLAKVTPVDDWQEYQTASAKDPQWLVVTLLSDAILRDEQGRFTHDITAGTPIQQKAHRSFLATSLTGGFNRTWGLPLPQTPVVCAGSVWVFAREPALQQALTDLVTTGIGERCNEGFGRIAVDLQSYPILEQQAPLPPSVLPTTHTFTGRERTLTQRMVDRLYRTQLQERLLGHLADAGLRISGTVPENAQLSRLRVIARRVWRERDPALLPAFLDHLKTPAKVQYRRATVGRKSLLQWLQEGWQNEQLWRDYFYIAPTDRPRIGDVTATESADLKLEYSTRLIDALCKKAIQQRNQEATQ